MKLTVKDRIVILGLLPKEGDFKTLKQLREFREDLSFTDIENGSLNFKQTDGVINWDEVDKDKPMTVEIDVSDSMFEVVSTALKGLDEKKGLNMDLFSLYERFVEPNFDVPDDAA